MAPSSQMVAMVWHRRWPQQSCLWVKAGDGSLPSEILGTLQCSLFSLLPLFTPVPNETGSLVEASCLPHKVLSSSRGPNVRLRSTGFYSLLPVALLFCSKSWFHRRLEETLQGHIAWRGMQGAAESQFLVYHQVWQLSRQHRCLCCGPALKRLPGSIDHKREST